MISGDTVVRQNPYVPQTGVVMPLQGSLQSSLKEGHPVVYEVTVKEQAIVEKKLHSKKPRSLQAIIEVR